MKKVFIVLIVLVLLFFIIPRIFYAVRYAKLVVKPVDYSNIISTLTSHDYKGVILGKISFLGKGEIYLLNNDQKITSLYKNQLEYYKEVSIFQDKKRMDPLDTFVKRSTRLSLSGDKNYIANLDWPRGGTFVIPFMDISAQVNDSEIPVWQVMKITKAQYNDSPDFGPYERLKNRLSPNGQYLLEKREGIDIHSYPYGLYKMGDVSKEKIEQLYQPVPDLANPIAISELYTIPVKIFKPGEVMVTSEFSFTWTEDSRFLLFRPDPISSSELFRIDAINGDVQKITSDFPLGTKIITAISPEELIVEYNPYETNFFDNNVSPGTYLVSIKQNEIIKKNLLPSRIKFIGFVH